MPLIINGETIDDDVIGQEFGEIKSQYERIGHVSCCERDDEFRGYARDNVIGRVLLSQQARQETNNISDAEIDAAVDELIKEHGGEQQFYFRMGIAPEQKGIVRENVRMSLSVDKLLKTHCTPGEPPTDEEILAYYTEHQEDYMTAEEVRAMHILKSVQKSEDREGLFNELRAIRQQALDGADFEELARQHTDKEIADIDLGWFKRGELMDEFEIMAFSMNLGEISPVFTIHGSFHLAKLVDRKPSQPIPLEEVREQVKEAIVNARQQEKVQAYIAELKAKATIEEIDEEAVAD